MSKKEKAPKISGERIYEVGYHLISSIAEENIPAEAAKIAAVLAKEKAIVIAEEAPKLRPLAYAIKKAFGGLYKTFDTAYFGFVKFELPEAGDIAAIDAALKGNENVLRYLIVKTVRENTMYSPKITVFSDKEGKIKTNFAPKSTSGKAEEKSASIEEIDKSIDQFVSQEVGI